MSERLAPDDLQGCVPAPGPLKELTELAEFGSDSEWRKVRYYVLHPLLQNLVAQLEAVEQAVMIRAARCAVLAVTRGWLSGAAWWPSMTQCIRKYPIVELQSVNKTAALLEILDTLKLAESVEPFDVSMIYAGMSSSRAITPPRFASSPR
jgi:hypothetical protein